MENGVDITFENCESVFIPEKYIFAINIKSSSDRFSGMTYYKIIDEMEMIIKKDVDESNNNRNLLVDKEKSIINRFLKYQDIAQIHVYKDNVHYFYIPVYDSETLGGENKNQSVSDSESLITILLKK